MILNLLINACAATPAGGNVHLRARATEGALTIEVGDQENNLRHLTSAYLDGLSTAVLRSAIHADVWETSTCSIARVTVTPGSRFAS